MSPKHRADAGADAGTTQAADAAAASADIRFVTQDLTPEEIAAATAVLTAALAAQSREAAARVTPEPSSAWAHSMRLRAPLHGDWRGFTGRGF